MTCRQTHHITAIVLATIGLAAPAMAQDALCGGSGANGQWIGGDQARSDIATADSYLEQLALVLGENQYVSLFTLSEGAEIRVEAEGRGAGDPIIDLLDNSGGVILSDDDSGGNSASRAETYLEAGSYCMTLRSYDSSPMTAVVRVSRTEQAALTSGADEANAEPTTEEQANSCEDAVPLGTVGASASASAEDTPYWSFTLDVPTAVSIRAENESADPVLTLIGSDGNTIDENDDFDGLNAQLDMTTPLQPGTYCIGITALSDTSLPITVSITEFDAAAALLNLYNEGQAAPPLDGSFPVTPLGTVQSRLQHDLQAGSTVNWFTVDVDDNSILLVEAIGTGGSDPTLVIYDDLGRLIGQNDDYAGGQDSLSMIRVQGGTYVIGVGKYGDDMGFVRLLVERYVRAQ